MVLDYGITSGETLKFHAERGPFTYFGRICLFFTLFILDYTVVTKLVFITIVSSKANSLRAKR